MFGLEINCRIYRGNWFNLLIYAILPCEGQPQLQGALSLKRKGPLKGDLWETRVVKATLIREAGDTSRGKERASQSIDYDFLKHYTYVFFILRQKLLAFSSNQLIIIFLRTLLRILKKLCMRK